MELRTSHKRPGEAFPIMRGVLMVGWVVGEGEAGCVGQRCDGQPSTAIPSRLSWHALSLTCVLAVACGAIAQTPSAAHCTPRGPPFDPQEELFSIREDINSFREMETQKMRDQRRKAKVDATPTSGGAGAASGWGAGGAAGTELTTAEDAAEEAMAQLLKGVGATSYEVRGA